MSFLIKDKNFYKLLFSITVPIAAQNFVSFAVSLADSLMLGKINETVLSGANLANQPFFILTIVTFGIISASMVFASQYWGKGDVYSIKRIMTIMLRIALGAGLFAGIIVLSFPEFVMKLYTNDKAVIEAGASYLRIVGWAYPLYAVTSATTGILRSAHVTTISLIVYLSSLGVNVFLNWVFIFGNLGVEPMGIAGAALATAIARCVEIIILIVYLIFFEKKIHYVISDFFVPVKEYIKPFIKTGLPVVINETTWSIGMSILSVIIGHISTEFVSANSIANTVWQGVWVIISGMAGATAVVLGNAIGSGENRDIVQKKAYTVIFVAFLLGIAASVILLLIRRPITDFYSIPQETKDLACDLMISYAGLILLECMSVQYVVGILRGGGDTKTAMFIDVFFLWTIAIPFGAYVGLVLHWAPPFVYLVLRSDQVMKCTIGFFRMKSGKWIKDITVGDAESA